MRQHDLSFANFILRFGLEEVMLDYAEDIVIPAFTRESNVRKYGDTSFRFYNVHFANVSEDADHPRLTLSGHFVKDTVLRREQIFRRDRGLVDDHFEIESAPSSFFVLILNNHRLLYFAETHGAPDLSAFQTTAAHFLKQEWRAYISRRLEHDNVTRRGSERITVRQLQRRIPPPQLSVIPVAGQDAITETIQKFKKVSQVKFKLVEPNDEIDASEAVAAVEKAFRPMEPKRLEVVAAQPNGLNKDEVVRTITEASETPNTEIIVDGEDGEGLKLKADNDHFALSVPIGDPPEDDDGLRDTLLDKFDELADNEKVKRPATTQPVLEKLKRIIGIL